VASPIIQMLRAGEKTGQIGQGCGQSLLFYQKKLSKFDPNRDFPD